MMISPPSRKTVLTYFFMPQIFSRLKDLSFNTHYIAYLLALIFSMTKLLPPAHPYIIVANMGRFGIRDVFTAARLNLKTDIKHIDQLIVYGSLMLGVALFVAMTAILIFLLFTQAAHASGALPSNWFKGMFITPYPTDDIALNMLDKVFQVPRIFYSESMPLSNAQITIFGHGLQAMFSFFSYGMLGIAGFIIFYYIIALLLESAQSGTPFGKRFADFYAPIRLVIAILLLIPLGNGFSAGQHTVLHLAKWGSALATNSWTIFNGKTSMTPTGMSGEYGVLSSRELIARPSYQDLEIQLRYYALVHSCRAIYANKYSDKVIKPYLIRFPQAGKAAEAIEVTDAMTFAEAMKLIGTSADVHIVYGEKKDSYDKSMANVRPYCGHVMLATAFYSKNSTALIKEVYFKLMKEMWSGKELRDYGDKLAQNHITPNSVTLPNDTDLQKIRDDYQGKYNALMNDAINTIRNSPNVVDAVNKDLLSRGWGGAGIWFNDVAQTNGAIMSTAIQTPYPVSYPKVMERSRALKGMFNPGSDTVSRFSPNFAGSMNLGQLFSSSSLDQGDTDADIAKFLGNTLDNLEDGGAFADPNRSEEQNPITGYINKVFGTTALFDFRGNQEVHPLAKMSALGRGIMDRAIFYLGSSMAMSGLSGMLGNTVDSFFESKAVEQGKQSGVNFGAAFDSFAAAFTAFAMVGITVGFVLYYVIPMLPFMYFFFAVGRWVKGIFEAMVCIPLWALAHLRIDGDGIPGQAAANGYFILLELFLRPIMTVFGLLAAVSVFSAQAIVLDSIFDLIVNNVAGHNYQATTGQDNSPLPKLSDIDQFFYTIVYAVLVYIMALASFKLIDLIPNGIMRFMGSSVGAFSDKSAFEAESTIQMTGIAGYQLTDDLARAGQQGAKAVGETVTLPVDMAIKMGAFKGVQDSPGGGGVASPGTPASPAKP
jgi:conjugal transfer/type IV secretion protein DotA/TraY